MPTAITATLAGMNDREKLMLIDMIADSLSNDLGCELHDGLTVAFEVAEQGFNGTWTPLYPAGVSSLNAWADWRKGRDAVLARKVAA